MEKTVFETGNISAMREMLDSMHIADIAEAMEEMDEQLVVKLFRMLPKSKAAEVFSYLSRDTRHKIVEAIADRELSGIMDELFLDDAVDFIEEMPANVVKRILAAVPQKDREVINHFLKYPEDSAGTVMTVEYVSLRSDMKVIDAFRHIREMAIDKETIYTSYVTDANRRLIGTVSAKKLLLANHDDIIGDIMNKTIIFAHTLDDKEELVNDFSKYDLLAMPIVDSENRLVGIVTVDDVLDVQKEEATEDFEIMAAITPSDAPYLDTSVISLTKNRVPWLVLLMVSAMLTGAIITGFESALAVVPALVAYIPMLMGTGGNSGAQSSTMVIRGMAIGDIQLSDIFNVLYKEMRVAFLCGAVLAAVNFTRIMVFNRDLVMAVTVSLSLYCTVIIAKSVGCMLPMLAKRLKLDPAVIASPMLSTIVDACALLVYFTLAKAFLHI